MNSLCLVKGDHPNTPVVEPIFWFQQTIMDSNPCQVGYLISSHFNEDKGVFFETFESLDVDDDFYTNDSPILLGPITKQGCDSIEDTGWWFEDYLTLNTPYTY